jgi:3-deoxy-7-phosphoheptulonate synthase
MRGVGRSRQEESVLLIRLPERSEALEKALLGRIWRVKPQPAGQEQKDVIYVIKGKIPEEILSKLPADSCNVFTGEAPLSSRAAMRDATKVKIGSAEFGGRKIVVCAGPCAVESRQQIIEAAMSVKKSGASVLRGGAFKPRTSPYSFQGLGNEGLKLLRDASDEIGIPVLTEATTAEQISAVAKYADAIQIGARNMQNFDLLRAAGRSGMPVVLKRGISATIEEWMLAAEYILLEGNWNLILCERGIRTYETATRNVLDVSGLALAKSLTHLPVIADPSHATGRRDLVAAASKAAIAAGADGLLIEVHPKPEAALSDGPQSLTPDEFAAAMGEISAVAKAVGRECP